MNTPISRRGILGGAPLLLAGCGKKAEYFGNTAAPPGRTLTFALGPEPEGLDPAKYGGGFELYILPSLFEGLIAYHPQTLEPTAGLATHFEINRNDTRFTFFLRGHPKPCGYPLPSTRSMPGDFARGISARDNAPARWTDGKIIIADDFVYSWRRVVDPATAAPFAYALYHVRNGREIHRGKRNPEDLGVRAVDSFTFEVELERPTALFLKLTGSVALSATPRQAIEAAKRSGAEERWTQADAIVTSGAFLLKQWRPYEHVVLAGNPHYYESDLVSLDAWIDTHWKPERS